MFQKMLQGGGVEQKDENIYVKHFDTLTADSNNRFLIDCDFTPKKISVFGSYTNALLAMDSFYDERYSTTSQHRFYNGKWESIGISNNKYANIYKENEKFYINAANEYTNVTILATAY